MATGKKASSIASKELSSKKASASEKTVAGSDLRQAPRKPSPTGKGKKPSPTVKGKK